MMTEFKMSPFVKWAGGKGQLLDTLIASGTLWAIL